MRRRIFAVSVLVFLAVPALFSQTPDPHSVPAIDAGIGSCTADFTVNDSSNAPIYNAKITVHIAYGTWSIRKLDLEVSTNVDGKARFTGLPNRLKRGLFFEASEGDRQAEAFDDVNKTCTTQFTLQLQKK
jgi:hypothetical protein